MAVRLNKELDRGGRVCYTPGLASGRREDVMGA